MIKWWKKIAIVVLSIFIIIPILAYVVLQSHQQELVQWAVSEANKNFKGKLYVGGSSINLFHDFPYVDIDLKDVAFTDTANVVLYKAKDVFVGFRWIDVFKGNFDVRLIDVAHAEVNVVQYENGDINILLAKNSQTNTESTDTSSIHIHLKKLLFEDVTIKYVQLPDSLLAGTRIDKLEASIFTDSQKVSVTLNSLAEINVLLKKDTSFFHDKKLAIETTLDYTKADSKLLFTNTHFTLDKAAFSISGNILLKDTTELDLKIVGEKPDFSMVTAFVSPEFAEVFNRYNNSGNVFFEGNIRGKVLENQLPGLTFRFGCENGFFQNTLNSTKIEDLQFSGSFTNEPQRTLESSVFTLRNFSLKPEKGRFSGSLTVKNFNDPQIAALLDADLDLSFVREFLGLNQIENLGGQVIVKMNFNELLDFNQPENALLKLKEGIESELIVRDLHFSLPDYPHPVEKLTVHADMKNGKVVMDTFLLKMADSDFSFQASVSNLPAIFHKENVPVQFSFSGFSKKINLSHLSKADTVALVDDIINDFKIKLKFESSVAQLKESPLPHGEFYIEDLFAKINGYPHTLHDLHADIIITDTTFRVKDFSGEIDQSDFHFNGLLTRYDLWFAEVKKGDTRFEFDLTSEQLRLDNLLTYKGENYLPEDYRHEVAKALKVHGLIDLYFNKSFRSADLRLDKVEAKLNVHPLKIENVRGRIHYEDEHISIRKLSAKMGESDFTIDLNYYTGTDSLLRKRDNAFYLKAKRLNLDQLLAYNPVKAESKDHAKAFNIFEIPFTDMSFGASIASLKHHQIQIESLQANARTTKNHYLFIDTLSMQIAGGTFALDGYLNGSDPKNIYFKSTTYFNQLDLDRLFIKFDNFGQDFLMNKNLHGLLSGTVKSIFHVHPDLTPILPEGQAHLDVFITQGSLVNFAPLQAMAGYFKDKNLNMVRFDTLRNTLDLKNGKLNIPAMTINSSLGYIEMEGSQSLDLTMDYLIRVPWSLVSQVGVQSLFGGKRKEEIDPEQVDAIQYRDENKRTRFLNVRINGTPDKFSFSLGKKRK
jgi:hypothetical protein